MKIKHFKIPSFEQAEHDGGFYSYIGDYKLFISVGFNVIIRLEVVVGFEIKNIFEEISQFIEIIGEDEAKAWYDQTIKKLNEFWEKYITQTYFSD